MEFRVHYLIPLSLARFRFQPCAWFDIKNEWEVTIREYIRLADPNPVLDPANISHVSANGKTVLDLEYLVWKDGKVFPFCSDCGRQIQSNLTHSPDFCADRISFDLIENVHNT